MQSTYRHDKASNKGIRPFEGSLCLTIVKLVAGNQWETKK